MAIHYDARRTRLGTTFTVWDDDRIIGETWREPGAAAWSTFDINGRHFTGHPTRAAARAALQRRAGRPIRPRP